MCACARICACVPVENMIEVGNICRTNPAGQPEIHAWLVGLISACYLEYTLFLSSEY